MLDRETTDRAQAELLGRIARQDREALAQLYDQLGRILFSIAVRMLGDRHEAEEVIQDVKLLLVTDLVDPPKRTDEDSSDLRHNGHIKAGRETGR